MRKVLIGTPTHSGLVSAIYCSSMAETIRHAPVELGIYPVMISGDALVQRARNDLVKMALETECDDLIFIDADQGWEPEWVYKILEHAVNFVGAPVVKKSDDKPDYNVVRLASLDQNEDGLVLVKSVGTGFLRLSRTVLEKVWAVSEEYTNGGSETGRMVFDVRVIDGELFSEDAVLCKKWAGDVWVDPTINPTHVGTKVWRGDFMKFIE